MRLTRADIMAIATVIGVVLFISVLPSPRDENPPVPTTPEHLGIESERDCLPCHGQGQRHALLARHPTRTDCFRCHQEGKSVGRLELKPLAVC